VKEEVAYMEKVVVRGVALDKDQAKVVISNLPDKAASAATIFKALADANINVDMIVQNTSKDGLTDISFTVPKADMRTAEDIVARVAGEIGAQAVTHDADIAKVSLVGAGMKTSPGIAARMFRVLADNNVNIHMISTSTIRVSVVIALADMETAVRALHTAFGLDSGTAYSAPLPERK
jgi:aspartate kinase